MPPTCQQLLFHLPIEATRESGSSFPACRRTAALSIPTRLNTANSFSGYQATPPDRIPDTHGHPPSGALFCTVPCCLNNNGATTTPPLPWSPAQNSIDTHERVFPSTRYAAAMSPPKLVAEAERGREEPHSRHNERVERLWAQLDPNKAGELDFKGLQKGLRRIDHRGCPNPRGTTFTMRQTWREFY